MSHLKSEFKYHKVFDNKYAEQSYLGYLTRGNERYIMNTGNWMNQNVVKPIDFIIRCNNMICRRKPVEENIKDIKELYTTPIRSVAYKDYYSKYLIKKYIWKLTEEEKEIECIVKIHEMMEQIIFWEDKIEENFEGFKDFIYDSMKYIEDNKLTYTIGTNIMYERSISDKINKKYYCYVTGDKGYKKFYSYYSSLVETDNIRALVDDISNLLITISDVYNLYVAKEDVMAKEFLCEYIEDNEDMKKVDDIYYRKIFVELEKFSAKCDSLTITDCLRFLKEIIVSENNKYSKQFLMYENVMIDENSLEESDYIEIDF